MKRALFIRGLALSFFAASALVAAKQFIGQPAQALEPAQKVETTGSSGARTTVRRQDGTVRPTSSEIEARRREQRVSSWPILGTGLGPGTTGNVRPDRQPGNNVVPLTPQECVGLGGTIVQTSGCASDDPLTSGYACQVQTRERNGNRVSVVVRQVCINQIG